MPAGAADIAKARALQMREAARQVRAEWAGQGPAESAALVQKAVAASVLSAEKQTGVPAAEFRKG